MFTGIIKHQGSFKGYRSGKQEIAVEASTLADQLTVGDSLAINGVCLSLIRKENDTLFFNLSEETRTRTTLGFLHFQERLNLELPLTLSTPLGGHLVTGHIDAVGKILRIQSAGKGRKITVSYPIKLQPYFVPQGSVALNGVSLTVADVSPLSFDVELIPLTLGDSSLSVLKSGDRVNIECDILGKYVYNWVSKYRR